MEFLHSRAPDNVLRYSYYGDWVAIEKTPGAEVSDFYYYYDTLVLSKMAAVLGNSADAATYAHLAGQIKDAFNNEFFDAKTDNYATGTQTANALPLFLDMVPKDRRGAVVGNLLNDILYRQNTHVTTGFIGLRYLMPVLTRVGLLRILPMTWRCRPPTRVGVTCWRTAPRPLGNLAEQDRDRR